MKLLEKEEDLGKIRTRLYKELMGRRYLIVMDDVWSTRALDDVWRIFPKKDERGSRIMLTTRLFDVATYNIISSNTPHEMRRMDENKSWNLLRHKVFTDSQDRSCPAELQVTGRKIAKSCQGLPLAIVVVAGVLSVVDRNQASWEKIAEVVNPVVASREGQLEKVLSLSYNHLPHHLRSCFLYMGGFPEDYEIHVSGLIRIWAAEGFTKRGDGNRSWEEKAEEFLEDLVKRSLVLVASRKSDRRIKSCTLHDLVREVCIRQAQEEQFLLHAVGRHVLPRGMERQRRVSFSDPELLSNLGPTIHTVMSFQNEEVVTSLESIEDFTLLRVLDLVNNGQLPLTDQLFELFHLRYLALRNFIEIPAAISKLENLQTLIVCPRTRWRARHSLPFYSSLPSTIWKMRQLRYLILFHYYELPDPDESTLPLENLHTLSSVANLVCSSKLMEMIPNIRKLGLIYNQDGEYHLYNLTCLQQLGKLKVTVFPEFSWRGGNRPIFPTALKKLTLVGGRFLMQDMAIIGSLPNLQVLKLIRVGCEGDTWRTAEGEFPQLKFLLIQQSDLQNWIAEETPFPALSWLVLRQCRLLNQIPDDVGEIYKLRLIEVDDQNQSLIDSARQIQADQEEKGNDTLQVRCVPHQETLQWISDPLKDMKEALLAMKIAKPPSI